MRAEDVPPSAADARQTGLGDLYVALTRATQRLGIVHSGEPPGALLARLRIPGVSDPRTAAPSAGADPETL
jgi:hypothetical protein